MSSRDFEYVKYTFKKSGEHWSVCVSDLSREEVNGKVRGEMVLTATRIVEVEGSIEVSVYSQIDMKIPIKMEIAKNRGFAEIRKYLDKVYNHLKTSDSGILWYLFMCQTSLLFFYICFVESILIKHLERSCDLLIVVILQLKKLEALTIIFKITGIYCRFVQPIFPTVYVKYRSFGPTVTRLVFDRAETDILNVEFAHF